MPAAACWRWCARQFAQPFSVDKIGPAGVAPRLSSGARLAFPPVRPPPPDPLLIGGIMSNRKNARAARLGEIVVKLPGTTAQQIQKWAESGEVPTYPDPTHPRYRLFDFGKAKLAWSKRQGRRQKADYPEFSDGVDRSGKLILWLAWMAINRKTHGVSKRTVRDWITKGKFADGATRYEWVEGFHKKLLYLRKPDLLSMTAPRIVPLAEQSAARPIEELERASDDNYVNAREADLLGFSYRFLAYYSSPERRMKGVKPRKAKSHPAIGRQIKTSTRDRIIDNRGIEEVTWRIGDLRAIKQWAPTIPRGHVLIERAGAKLKATAIIRLIKNGEVPGGRHWTKDKRGRAAKKWFVHQEKLLNHPQEVRKSTIGLRKFWIEREWWYPQLEAAELVGVREPTICHWRRTGAIRWRPHEPGSVSAHGKDLIVYAEKDLRLMEREIQNLPAPKPLSPPPSSKTPRSLHRAIRRVHKAVNYHGRANSGKADKILEVTTETRTDVKAGNAAHVATHQKLDAAEETRKQHREQSKQEHATLFDAIGNKQEQKAEWSTYLGRKQIADLLGLTLKRLKKAQEAGAYEIDGTSRQNQRIRIDTLPAELRKKFLSE